MEIINGKETYKIMSKEPKREEGKCRKIKVYQEKVGVNGVL